MLRLNQAKIAAETTALIVQRGAGVPPLAWHGRPLTLPKETLNAIDDGGLLGLAEPVDEQMAAAVRALLYVWNGWPADGQMYAQGTHERERRYLVGICHRQADRFDQAKAEFREMQDHPVYSQLTGPVAELVGASAEASLRRFADIVKLAETWEPFAFIDLYAQARAGKLCQAAEEAVCRLQAQEFELLFAYCYQGATGVDIRAQQETQSTPRKRPPVRRSPTARRASSPSTPAKPPLAENKPVAKPAGPPSMVVGVLCPKCGVMKQVPKTMRGKCVRCDKCGAGFMVPLNKTRQEPVRPSTKPIGR